MYYMPRVDAYDVLTAASGWKILWQDAHMQDGWAILNCKYERTGPKIDPGGNGNLVNETVMTVAPDWIPQSWFFMGGGESGQNSQYSISNNGLIRLNAIAGNGTIPTGYEMSIRGIYHMSL